MTSSAPLPPTVPPAVPPARPASRPPAVPPVRPASRPPAVPPAQRRERTAGHIVAIVVGVLALLPALGVLAGGVTLAVGSAVVADDDGYYRYSLDRIDADGVAVAATDLWLDDPDSDAPWVFDWLDVDLRLRVESAGEADVFVGVARTPDVERYLDGAAWSDVIELDGRVARLDDIDGDGTVSIPPPNELDIWTEAVSGPGEQELVWAVRDGAWSIVVMNADGSSGIAADVELGARSGAVVPIATIMMIAGGTLAVVSIVLIVVGSRGRRRPGSPLPPPPVATPTGYSPAGPRHAGSSPIDVTDAGSSPVASPDRDRDPVAVG